MPVPHKRFYMIRHGETEANAAQIMAGGVDTPLTELGRAQADAARVIVEALTEKPTLIVHSHLSRARDTATIINQNLGLPMIEDPDYAEWHVGDWEGQPWANFKKTIEEAWKNPPNGETAQTFINRVRTAKNKALSQEGHLPLIVCHGGVFRAFGKLYDLETWGVRNCHLHRFDPNPARSPFPWDAIGYEHDEGIITTLSESFHD